MATKEPPVIYQSFVATRVVNRIRSSEVDNVETAIDEAISSNPAYADFQWAGVKGKIQADIETRITGSKAAFQPVADAKKNNKAKVAAKAAASPEPEEYDSMDDLMADPNLVVPKAVIAKGRKNPFSAPKVASVDGTEGKLWTVQGASKGGPDCGPTSKAFHAIVEGEDILGCRKIPTAKK